MAMPSDTPASVLPPQLPIDILDSPALVTTSDPQVAERRRERARALIDARLVAKVASSGSGAGRTSPLRSWCGA